MSRDGKALWCAVIEQALIDATKPLSSRLIIRLEQIRAREWLTKPNRDFEDVCALAGIEADKVRVVATQRITEAIKHDRELVTFQKSASQPRNTLYHHEGRSLTIRQWAAATGISRETIYDRLKRGWTFEQTITMPRGTRLGATTRGVGLDVLENANDRLEPIAPSCV
jgi:predicted DNA-binding transcriptional regulator AlpA